MVKNLSAMQETQIWSLRWEDPLDKRMATHSSIFAWRIPWTQEPGWLQFMGSQRKEHDWAIYTFTVLEAITCEGYLPLLWRRYFWNYVSADGLKTPPIFPQRNIFTSRLSKLQMPFSYV